MGTDNSEAVAGGSPGGPAAMLSGFGPLLRQLREARGLSQSALAGRAGFDRSYINRLEAGERGTPAPAATEALAQALDLGDAEADRFYAAAGLLPRSLLALGPADPTLLLLAQRLTDPRLSVAARAALRATVETMVRCWANPVNPVSLGSPPGPVDPVDPVTPTQERS